MAAANPGASFASQYRDMVVKNVWSNEAKSTAEVIRRIPEDKLNFKPHEKSMPAFELAKHIVMAETMFVEALCSGKFDFEAASKKAPTAETPKALADKYTQWVEGAAARLLKLDDAALSKMLQFHPKMPNLPAFTYLTWLTSHTIHHRGQLEVYLRMCGAKLPAIYGGSADEKMF